MNDFEIILEHIKEAVLVIIDNKICYVNHNWAHFTGFLSVAAFYNYLDDSKLRPKTLLDFFYHEDRQILANHIDAKSPLYLETCSIRLQPHDDKNKDVLCNISIVKWKNQDALLLALTDISHVKEAEKSEIQLRQLFTEVYDASPYMVSLSTRAEGKIVFVNKAFEKKFGHRREDIIDRSALDLNLWPKQSDREKLLKELSKNGYLENFRIQGKSKEGKIYPVAVWISIIKTYSEPLVLMAGFDKTEDDKRNAELLDLNQKLTELSQTDFLTKVLNRRAITNILIHEINRTTRHGGNLSVLLIDVDFFKHVNDQHGHAAGDEALQQLCTHFNTQLRSHDSLGRWGGEEFLIITPETDSSEVNIFAERIRKAIYQTTIRYQNNMTLQLTVSIGTATLNKENNSFAALVKQADDSLYQAKNSGRNRVVTH
jgi:diguanylate cyclase (GGDEF)-like protein/PAS domain S-box-containing protein